MALHKNVLELSFDWWMQCDSHAARATLITWIASMYSTPANLEGTLRFASATNSDEQALER